MLQKKLDAWVANDMVTAIVLQGREGVFSGGADLDWLAANRARAPELFTALGKLYRSVAAYPKPLVAILSGDVSGAALSLGGSLRVVTPSTRFSVPEASVGLVPDGPVLRLLADCDVSTGLPMASYLSLTGAAVGPEDLMRTGIGAYHHAGSDADPLLRQLAVLEKGADVAPVLSLYCEWKNSEGMISGAKAALDGADLDWEDEGEGSSRPFSPEIRSGMKACFGRDRSVEESMTLLAERGDAWSKEALTGMQAAPAMGLLATQRLVVECGTLKAGKAAALASRVAARLAENGAAFSDVIAHDAAVTTASPTSTADLRAIPSDQLDELFAP